MDDLTAKQRETAKLRYAYIYDPDFIEQRYQVPSVGDLLAGDGVLAVARLIELPSFCSEELHTFVYSADSVVVTTVRGATSLWGSIPQFGYINDSPDPTEFESIPFVAEAADRRSTALLLSIARMPSMIASWIELIAAARATPSCATDTEDGVSYRHRVRSQGVVIDADWRNPDQRQHIFQVRLLVAYMEFLRLADLFPEEREAAERRRLRNRENKLARKKRKEERRKNL